MTDSDGEQRYLFLWLFSDKEGSLPSRTPIMKTALALLSLTLLTNPLNAADPLDAARSYLEENRVYHQPVVPPADYAALKAKIAALRDPKTKFGPYIFRFANPKANVLTAEQSEKLQAVIEARRTNPVNWHDVRNIVRVQSLLVMWDYAGATDPSKIAELDKQWSAWTEVRLAYMFEEFVMQDRFQRAAWAIFTPEQRQKLIAGEYDSLGPQGARQTAGSGSFRQDSRRVGTTVENRV